ncbi:Glycosyl transferase family 2 (fragment) [Desulfamplus magnetovallimortis]|uniref:Glycosyl transferase family 2 n=1 Tax=Desulfamplus magnetovallimortis TaxID=1246637 RepID=A0A1W1HC91_9BACT
MIKVIHFSITPLAGAPIRLVQALNRLTSINARLVDLNRYDLYDHDVVFSETPDLAKDLAEESDIIHLHNYLDCNSTQFHPIDFATLRKKGKRIVRHFHSTPDWIAEVMGISEDELCACTLPSLVIAQYPERFFINSRVVPNLIPHSDMLYLPAYHTGSENHDGGSNVKMDKVKNITRKENCDIFFSYTKTVGAFERRWDTKGAPETIAILERVVEKTGCTCTTVTGKPLGDVLKHKQQSNIVVDDLVTGSYHLTGLEGLSQGKAVLSFLDQRSLQLLRYISGSDHCPFINVRLEDAEKVLTWLLDNPETCRDIGNAGRMWILDNWNGKKLIQHFTRAYSDLLESSDSDFPGRQSNLLTQDAVSHFFNKTLHDIVYNSRREKANSLIFWNSIHG